eukprot:CAMPEP_0204366014 /NCGR_PEP_ID=MMETSP0469-20131031/42347_1 /ASSEMBLY_ACC=CAM_ASM_000384 /TAXON_ID=2969 /ORGANISM="Oxyrrhis marina" /LENGTH=46 /DNA_ID= /DNA_START= /DNA_END= /DNA_ORIENTATION=
MSCRAPLAPAHFPLSSTDMLSHFPLLPCLTKGCNNSPGVVPNSNSE